MQSVPVPFGAGANSTGITCRVSVAQKRKKEKFTPSLQTLCLSGWSGASPWPVLPRVYGRVEMGATSRRWVCTLVCAYRYLVGFRSARKRLRRRLASGFKRQIVSFVVWCEESRQTVDRGYDIYSV